MLPDVPQGHRETANGWRSSRESQRPDYMIGATPGFARAGRPGRLSPHGSVGYPACMDAVTLTRQLVDIESISGNEAAVGNFLYVELCRLGYQTKKMPVASDRFNVYATTAE